MDAGDEGRVEEDGYEIAHDVEEEEEDVPRDRPCCRPPEDSTREDEREDEGDDNEEGDDPREDGKDQEFLILGEDPPARLHELPASADAFKHTLPLVMNRNEGRRFTSRIISADGDEHHPGASRWGRNPPCPSLPP